MGGSISKRFNRSKRTDQGNTTNSASRSENQVKRILKEGGVLVKNNYNAYSLGLDEAKSEEVEDALLKDIMRTQLALDSQMFVLNQLLLGVQFFPNYDV